MIESADRTYVLAHAAKLGARPFHAWARLPGSWTLVTDNGAEPAAIAPFIAHGAQVVADADGHVTE